jgi:Mn2+/Fe2+ NRAMP family transporter
VRWLNLFCANARFRPNPDGTPYRSTGQFASPASASGAASLYYRCAVTIADPTGKRLPRLARSLRALLTLAIVGGVAITFMHFDPIRALYWSAVIHGVTALPIMIIMMLMARSRRVMEQFAVTGVLAVGGWLATIAAVGVFVPT